MKKILIIAPYSFPVTDAEAIVNINLISTLCHSEKFQIDLISRKYKSITYPSADLESYGVKLNRLDAIEVDNKLNVTTGLLLAKSFLFFGVAFKGSHWAAKVLNIASCLVKGGDYDYILTKSSPSLLIGHYLKKKYGIKWVASWNDPYPQSKYPAPYGYGSDFKGSLTDRKLIRIMRQADVHVFPSLRLANYMQRYLKVNKDHCHVIPHAIIPKNYIKKNCTSSELKLVHSGNLGVYRNALPLLQALSCLLLEKPDYRISLTFIGEVKDEVKEVVKKSHIKERVFFTPPVEYNKSLEIICDYDVAVIIEASVKEGIFLPTKVGDFISLSMPIFSISPIDGVLNDMYNRNEISYFAEVDNVDSIKQTLDQIYKDFSNNSIKSVEIDIQSKAQNIVNQYLSF